MPRIEKAGERARLRALELSYREVGASAETLPAGYRHLEVERRLGRGPERFALAAQRLLTWEMHRRAGLRVEVLDGLAVDLGATALLEVMIGGRWPIAAPVRVVELVSEPDAQGFAYGTLPGHPESGEERFVIHRDPDDTVRATIRAFSRPARWFSRVGAPVARRMQDLITERYLDALSC